MLPLSPKHKPTSDTALTLSLPCLYSCLKSIKQYIMRVKSIRDRSVTGPWKFTFEKHTLVSKQNIFPPEEDVVSWSLSPGLLSSADWDGPGQLERLGRGCLRCLRDLCDLNMFWSTNSFAPFFRNTGRVKTYRGVYKTPTHESMHTCSRKQFSPHGSVSIWISLFFLL